MPLQPENINFLHENKFQMNFSLLPGLTYFGTNINLPGISLPTADHPNPFATIRIHGDTLAYEDLVVQFNVDEDLQTWKEIFDWLVGLSAPQKFEQFADRKGKKNLPPGIVVPDSENSALYSDATLLIQTSAKNVNIEATFTNISPTALDGLEFTSQENDTNHLRSRANFVYDYYTIKIK